MPQHIEFWPGEVVLAREDLVLPDVRMDVGSGIAPPLTLPAAAMPEIDSLLNRGIRPLTLL